MKLTFINWVSRITSRAISGNVTLGFLVFLAITWTVSRVMGHLGFIGADVLEGYYQGFRYSSLWDLVRTTGFPETWPDEDIRSYAYDFSVLWAISDNLDVVINKPAIMPDNVLPYGPISFLFFYLFSFLDPFVSLSIYRLLSISAFLLAIAVWVWGFNLSTKKRLAVLAGLILLSTPLHIFLASGNVEIFVFALTLIGVANINKRPELAAVLIAFAASVKYYPILFLFLFLRYRNLRAFFLGGILSAVLFFLPFALLKGNYLDNFLFTFQEIATSMKLCVEDPLIFCHYGGLSMANIFFNVDFLGGNASYQIAIALVVITGVFGFIRTSSLTQAVLILVTSFCLIPQVSVFYKISYLILVVLIAGIENNYSSLLKFQLFLIAICLSAVPFYLTLSVSGRPADFSMLLLVLHFSVFFSSMKEPKLNFAAHRP